MTNSAIKVVHDHNSVDKGGNSIHWQSSVALWLCNLGGTQVIIVQHLIIVHTVIINESNLISKPHKPWARGPFKLKHC